jgi:hypothetical protein
LAAGVSFFSPHETHGGGKRRILQHQETHETGKMRNPSKAGQNSLRDAHPAGQTGISGEKQWEKKIESRKKN